MPSLVVAGETDSLIPIKSIKKTVKKMKQPEFMTIPGGHFDLYFGEQFDIVSKKQLEFFKKHLT
jgi:poly(3-hydroxyalkanoate) synthetase